MEFWTRNMGHVLDRFRLIGRPGRVIIHYPSESPCPACGWDEFAQAALKSDCTVCQGVGKTITWKKWSVRARVVWTATDLRYLAPTPGIELGDVTLGIAKPDLVMIEKTMAQERSYIVVDGKTVKATNVSPMVMPGIEEGYLVQCNLYTPASA